MRKVLLLLTLFFCVFTNSVEAMNEVKRIALKEIARKQGGSKPERAPIRIPDAYIDGHTLTFDASCIGSTLTLTQDDIIIYSATVEENENGEGEVILPDYLTGEYEIEIEYGSFVLVGNLEIS